MKNKNEVLGEVPTVGLGILLEVKSKPGTSGVFLGCAYPLG